METHNPVDTTKKLLTNMHAGEKKSFKATLVVTRGDKWRRTLLTRERDSNAFQGVSLGEHKIMNQ